MSAGPSGEAPSEDRAPLCYGRLVSSRILTLSFGIGREGGVSISPFVGGWAFLVGPAYRLTAIRVPYKIKTTSANCKESVPDSVELLDHRRDSHPGADALCGQAVSPAASSQFMRDRSHQASASGTQRMTNRQRAAVYVDVLRLDA